MVGGTIPCGLGAARTPFLGIKEIYADEGDFVTAGQPLARMDMATLEAQRREAEAKLHAAIVNVDTARSRVAQREAEKGQT